MLENLQNIYFSGEYQVVRHLFWHTGILCSSKQNTLTFFGQDLPIQQCSSSQTISPKLGVGKKTQVSNINIHY